MQKNNVKNVNCFGSGNTFNGIKEKDFLKLFEMVSRNQIIIRCTE